MCKSTDKGGTGLLKIENPKRDNSSLDGRAGWYPYYAGFSPLFAQTLLASAKLSKGAIVLDPWNGAGTTTSAASGLGYASFGYDRNPVMVIASKARMVSKGDSPSIGPLTKDIVKKALRMPSLSCDSIDPLCAWFSPTSAATLRSIDRAVQKLLVDEKTQTAGIKLQPGSLSHLAAFFYTALFRTVRELLRRFRSSNPTWMKVPKNVHERLRPNPDRVISIFTHNVEKMADAFNKEHVEWVTNDTPLVIDMASSEALPLSENSVDFVLTSPPYCTRIDYAMATLPDLATLGMELDKAFYEFRRGLIGNAMVPQKAAKPEVLWGDTCVTFLEQLRTHDSKASETYYYKNHLQYFGAMFRSISRSQEH